MIKFNWVNDYTLVVEGADRPLKIEIDWYTTKKSVEDYAMHVLYNNIKKESYKW